MGTTQIKWGAMSSKKIAHKRKLGEQGVQFWAEFPAEVWQSASLSGMLSSDLCLVNSFGGTQSAVRTTRTSCWEIPSR